MKTVKADAVENVYRSVSVHAARENIIVKTNVGCV
jgi:hypothetical protein